MLDKSEEKLLDLGVLEIKFKGKRQLVAAVLCPRGADGLAVLGSKGSENTGSVAYAGTLDVDDLCAEVGEDHGAERAGEHRAQVKDFHAFKRSCH